MNLAGMEKQRGLLHLSIALAFLSVGYARASSSTSTAEQQQEWTATHGQIRALPGYAGAQLTSKHYGGYISVGSKQLYYYMVESERDPANDPVV